MRSMNNIPDYVPRAVVELRRIRVERNITAKMVAGFIGVHVSYWNKLEVGEMPLRPSIKDKVEELLRKWQIQPPPYLPSNRGRHARVKR